MVASSTIVTLRWPIVLTWFLYGDISKTNFWQSLSVLQRCPSWMKSSWWRHQMETFSTLLALCAGNSPVTGEFPSQRPVTRSFDVFLYFPLNKQLGKQSKPLWFETSSRSLWSRCNELSYGDNITIKIMLTANLNFTEYRWGICPTTP